MNSPFSGRRVPVCDWLLRLTAVAMGGTVALGACAAAPEGKREAAEALGKLYHCKPGPWGTLEYYHVHVEMPDRLLAMVARPDPTPRWSFPGGTEATLRALFQRAGLSGALQDYLLAADRQMMRDKVLTVFPPLPDLVAMTPEQRAVIYRELAKSELNQHHANPTFIANGDPESWFEESNLRPELQEMVKKMTYMRGEVLCFSDLPALFAKVTSESEATDVLRAMSRTSSLMLRLNVKKTPNMEEAARYWSGNQRNRGVVPVLRSAAETAGIECLDCIHLLPPLPKRCVNTYFSGEFSIFSVMPNCHWTSLNFMNAEPFDYHLDPRMVALHLTEDYTRVEPPYRFGDVLAFMGASGDLAHSCVYVADDICYTKNGQDVATPWVLNKLGYLQKLYSHTEKFKVQGFRHESQQTAP